MTGARGATVQIALVGSAVARAVFRQCDRALSRRQCFEDGLEVLDHFSFATNHLAVTSFETPYAPAGANIEIMNAGAFQFCRSTNVIDVVGVATVDDDVAVTKQ